MKFAIGFTSTRVLQKSGYWEPVATFFNGIILVGTRPWANFKHAMLDRGLLEQFIRLVQTYLLSEYLRLRPYIPPTKYDEREELSFRAVFLKVYRAQNVTLTSGNRVPVVTMAAGLTKAGASHMRIMKSSARVYVPSLSPQEIEELPKSWGNIATPKKEDPQNLFVGAFSWWGISDKLKAIDSPQKVSITKTINSTNIMQNINLRPSTASRLMESESDQSEKSEKTNAVSPRKFKGRGASRLGGRARKIHCFQKKIESIF